jgi:hypothetical protein
VKTRRQLSRRYHVRTERLRNGTFHVTVEDVAGRVKIGDIYASLQDKAEGDIMTLIRDFHRFRDV